MKRRAFLGSLGSVGAGLAALAVRPVISAAQDTNAFDIVIVGAGSSGCVVAHRLSADPSVRVLVIETGEGDGAAAMSDPGQWVSLLGTSVDWNYRTEPATGLDGRALQWPRGKTVGGSSAINAMAYVRGHRASYDAWARLADPSWGYDQVLPIFRQLEDNSRGPSTYHGAGGALAVSDTTNPHAGHLAFLEAARALGYGASPTWDFNGAQQENGAGFYQKNIRQGRRHSAADAFLRPVQARPNLTLWPRTTARRLVIERGRVTGLDVVRDGRPLRVAVRREVVLSGGVIESPKLLLLSGIGPADRLKAIGIAPLVDAPEVGENLHDHPRVSPRWAARSPLAPSSVSAGLFVRAGGGRSEAGASPPDLQFYVGRGLDAADPFVTLTVAVSAPQSRGFLQLRNADPEASPLIHPGYFSDPADLEVLIEGVRLARALVATRAYDGVRGAAVDPDAEAQTPAALRAYVRRAADTIFHPVGTCRMGADPRSVVDPQLRVRGVDGLRVADGSVMPVSVNSQTHAACLLIGWRAADFIQGR